MDKQKITPHLWYDKEAKEAAEFYVSTISAIGGSSSGGAGDSKIKNLTTLENTPSGSVDIVTFDLLGYEFMAISAGPLFKFNPSISFHVKCNTIEEVDAIWKKLSDGGKVLMELGSYPFSKRYGWTKDKYGLSWQIIYVDKAQIKPRIVPVCMFVDKVCGKAEEAVNFYASVFSAKDGSASGGHSAKANILARYGKGEEPDKEGTVKYAAFSLDGQEFGAMDSAHEHNFNFNESISFIVRCDTQKEIDYYWEKLSAVPEAEQCGWLKDKYGLSWQIVPSVMDEMMKSKDKEKIGRVTEAFLKMKKFDIATLKRAYDRA